jgi:hypothetical protein
MTADPTHPSRVTKQESCLDASAMKELVGAQRRDRREPHSMPVQRAGCVVVDAPATTVEDASLVTSRWCKSRDCRRRATPGAPTIVAVVVADAAVAVVLTFSLPLAHTLALSSLLGLGQKG